jgi:hypothetical protein
LGWVWVDQVLDVSAMVLTCWALGFHFLLLPTVIIEFIPVIDALPTWTACTAVVILLRKRAQQSASQNTVPQADSSLSPPIEVTAEVTHVPPKL